MFYDFTPPLFCITLLLAFHRSYKQSKQKLAPGPGARREGSETRQGRATLSSTNGPSTRTEEASPATNLTFDLSATPSSGPSSRGGAANPGGLKRLECGNGGGSERVPLSSHGIEEEAKAEEEGGDQKEANQGPVTTIAAEGSSQASRHIVLKML